MPLPRPPGADDDHRSLHIAAGSTAVAVLSICACVAACRLAVLRGARGLPSRQAAGVPLLRLVDLPRRHRRSSPGDHAHGVARRLLPSRPCRVQRRPKVCDTGTPRPIARPRNSNARSSPGCCPPLGLRKLEAGAEQPLRPSWGKVTFAAAGTSSATAQPSYEHFHAVARHASTEETRAPREKWPLARRHGCGRCRWAGVRGAPAGAEMGSVAVMVVVLCRLSPPHPQPADVRDASADRWMIAATVPGILSRRRELRQARLSSPEAPGTFRVRAPPLHRWRALQRFRLASSPPTTP